MYYSEQVPKFKEAQKQIKVLMEQRKQILKDMIPDIQKAILSKMDWESLKVNSYDDHCGEILISVSNPKEGEHSHRYVFAVDLREHGEFYLNLQFREEYKSY